MQRAQGLAGRLRGRGADKSILAQPESLTACQNLVSWILASPGICLYDFNFLEVSDVTEERFVDVTWQRSLTDVINPSFHHQRCHVNELNSEGAAPLHRPCTPLPLQAAGSSGPRHVSVRPPRLIHQLGAQALWSAPGLQM